MTEPASTEHPATNRSIVHSPVWWPAVGMLAMSLIVGGTLYFAVLVVNSAYQNGFDAGWYRGQMAERTAKTRTKPIQDSIVPKTPTKTKGDQPPG